MGYRVLLVDDDDHVQSLKGFFLLKGWDAHVATDGLEALQVLDPTFDAVVLDSCMPQMNGEDVLEAIRRRPDLDRVFVVMLTAYAEAYKMRKAFQAGSDYYLTKPISATDLEKFLVFGILRKRAQARLIRVLPLVSRQA